MTERGALLNLLLFVGVSVVGPLAAVRLKLPSAVVLILAGIALGPAGLQIVGETPTIAFLSQFGFLILMFIAGMEIDFEAIRDAGRSALVRPFVVSLAIGVLSLGVAILRKLGPIETLVLGAISVGMPLAVLQDTGQIRTQLGRYVLVTASIGEFLCIIAITGVEIASGEGGVVDMSTRVGKMLVLFAVSAIAIRFARALVWWYPEPFSRLVDHHDVAELGVRVGLALMLAFVLMSAIFGVEPILGAFIAGALVSFVLRQKHSLESKIAAVGHGFFVPIFFVMVGVRFNARVLDLESLKQALVLSGFAFAAKLVPNLLFSWRELGFRQRFAAGSLLSAPLTLVVAIAGIGHELHRIDDRQNATLLLMGMMVSVVLPIVFKLLVGPPKPEGNAPAGGAAGVHAPHAAP